MPFLLILVGTVLALSAYNNTLDQLSTALEQDLPGYAKWAAAIGGIVVLGWIPGMRDLSRMLLALVLVVIVVRNYQNVLASFQGLTQPVQPAQAAATPVQTYAQETQAISGLGSSSAVSSIGQGIGGFGAGVLGGMM